MLDCAGGMASLLQHNIECYVRNIISCVWMDVSAQRRESNVLSTTSKTGILHCN